MQLWSNSRRIQSVHGKKITCRAGLTSDQIVKLKETNTSSWTRLPAACVTAQFFTVNSMPQEILMFAPLWARGVSRRVKFARRLCSNRNKKKDNAMTHFIAHVERENHHAEVVDYENSLEVEGFAVLHYPRPQRCDKVNVRRDDDRLGERGRHKEPVLRPRVCNGRGVDRFVRSMQRKVRRRTVWKWIHIQNQPQKWWQCKVLDYKTCHKGSYRMLHVFECSKRLTCILDELIINECSCGLYAVKFHFHQDPCDSPRRAKRQKG